MKVYVIKNKQGQYQTPDISFISSLWQADLFNDYEVAKYYCEKDCEIVECELIEKTELADYTKQVRKEVVQEIKAEFEPSDVNHISKSMYPPTKEAELIGKGFRACKERFFKKLDQIQGETK